MSKNKILCGIYALVCPYTKNIKYIGQSININKRYKEHLRANAKYPVYKWIKELKKNGKNPILKIIKLADKERLDQLEIEEIKRHGISSLLNVSIGGKLGYHDLARKKPWVAKGVACPTKYYLMVMRNSFPDSSVINDVKNAVLKCSSTKERVALELRFAFLLIKARKTKVVNKWLSDCMPAFIKDGYV